MLTDLLAIVRRLKSDRDGVTALEYGLIASLIAVFIIGGLTALGTALDKTFASITAQL